MGRSRVIWIAACAVAAVNDGCGSASTQGRQSNAPGLADGYHIKPTAVRARSDVRVSQEEVFGPFVVVSTFSADDEALQMANATEYGLGGGLWTRDLARAHRAAGALSAGMVWVNVDAALPVWYPPPSTEQ